MRKIIVSSLLSLFLIVGCRHVVDPENDELRTLTETEKSIINSSGNFGFNVFKKVNELEGDKNIFISPLSISVALGMTLNGANNETYDAMQTTLDLDGLSNDQINQSYQSLIKLLTSIDPKVTFQIANSIWYRDDLTFKQQFLNNNKHYFDASVEPLDFDDLNSVNIINNWCNENTNGKIKEIIESIPRNAVMYLLNAIYFNGTWKYEFNKDNTVEDIFYSTGKQFTANFMVQQNDFNYIENEKYQAIELSYGDGNFCMVVILPSKNYDIDTLIRDMNSENWSSMISNFEETSGTLILPKFKLECNIKLNNILKEMGMEAAFDPSKADFSNLYDGPENLFISKVQHKTFVKVDEEGTEAAAVTLVEINRTTSGGDGFRMNVNRPFIFIIKEKTSEALLFMGKVIEPLN